jgi:hypothetical protein
MDQLNLGMRIECLVDDAGNALGYNRKLLMGE